MSAGTGAELLPHHRLGNGSGGGAAGEDHGLQEDGGATEARTIWLPSETEQVQAGHGAWGAKSVFRSGRNLDSPVSQPGH